MESGSVLCWMLFSVSYIARVLHLLSEPSPVELGIAVSRAHCHFLNGGSGTKGKIVSFGVLFFSPSFVYHIRIQREHTDDGGEIAIIVTASAKNPLEMAVFLSKCICGSEIWSQGLVWAFQERGLHGIPSEYGSFLDQKCSLWMIHDSKVLWFLRGLWWC